MMATHSVLRMLCDRHCGSKTVVMLQGQNLIQTSVPPPVPSIIVSYYCVVWDVVTDFNYQLAELIVHIHWQYI